MTRSNEQNLLDRRARLLGAGATLFYSDPIHIVRGEGVWLYDDEDRPYLDLYNNVPCVGHCHPHVVEALHNQATRLNVHSRYLHERVLDYAERLADLHASALTTTVFSCTGTEANEVSLAIARAASGGRGIICTDAAYHGNSAEVAKLTRVVQQDEPDSEVSAIPFPQRYRPPEADMTEDELCAYYLARLDEAIGDFDRHSVKLAGLILCPILANEGLPQIPRGFLPEAVERVRRAGGLVIADEVQSGFCRTGRWWGYDLHGFEPDIVTMGKPMGNGFPVAGSIASREHVEAFRQERRYFNTFASSPVQAAVGMAVIDVIEEERLLERAADLGAYLLEQVKALQANHEPMGDVRGDGLFLGIEWVSDRESKTPDPEGAEQIVDALKEKGFLIGAAGLHRNVLKVRPPLVFAREHADLFLTALEETLSELATAHAGRPTPT